MRNYQARNFLRDDMQIGDRAIYYHSNCEPSAAVGVCEICSEAVIDPTAFDSASEYYDAKSKQDSPTWLTRHVKFVSKFARPVPLDEMKEDASLAGLDLLRRGNRLSVQKVSNVHFDIIVKLGKKP